ncbi:MAG TPA: helix-turn-helix transcriptional regulator [Trebonia sp.]|jgi:transcriptional regulator with XRE-family HTH domain|nr:helix-turn-helix transcriptional regulator [Trebonia sp.]
MEDAEISAKLSHGSGYADLPGKHVTINQIVAWNMTHWRKIAGLTQEELGDRLKWSAAVVSAAERSWDAKRIRQFSVDDLVNIAEALDLPVSALLLPPLDDGNELRYLFHLRNMDFCHNMYDLVNYVTSEPSEDDTPVMNRYRERYVTARNFYFGAGPEEGLKYLEDLTTEERVVDRLEQLREQYTVLRDVLGDNDKTQEALLARLSELRKDRPRGRGKDHVAEEAAARGPEITDLEHLDDKP